MNRSRIRSSLLLLAGAVLTVASVHCGSSDDSTSGNDAATGGDVASKDAAGDGLIVVARDGGADATDATTGADALPDGTAGDAQSDSTTGDAAEDAESDDAQPEATTGEAGFDATADAPPEATVDAQPDVFVADTGVDSPSDATSEETGSTCPVGTPLLCNGTCINPATSDTFCGASGSCTGANVGVTCSATQTCTDGQCVCSTGLVSCGGSCINPQTNDTYCGASGSCSGTGAGTSCTLSETCTGGQCVCNTGLVSCGGSCIDPKTNDTYCGASGSCTGGNVGTTCSLPETCSGGTCVCATPNLMCDGMCVNPQTDQTYCGATGACDLGTSQQGTTCEGQQVCTSGTCVLPPCPAGLLNCGGYQCVDPQSDPSYCGASTCGEGGEVCGVGARANDPLCFNGTCIAGPNCPAFYAPCGGGCTMYEASMVYCGASGNCGNGSQGHACAVGQVCDQGVCGPTCTAPFVMCGDFCTDRTQDPGNCGFCGNKCNPNEACVTGTCTPF